MSIHQMRKEFRGNGNAGGGLAGDIGVFDLCGSARQYLAKKNNFRFVSLINAQYVFLFLFFFPHLWIFFAFFRIFCMPRI